jgi:hypothetical protein
MSGSAGDVVAAAVGSGGLAAVVRAAPAMAGKGQRGRLSGLGWSVALLLLSVAMMSTFDPLVRARRRPCWYLAEIGSPSSCPGGSARGQVGKCLPRKVDARPSRRRPRCGTVDPGGETATERDSDHRESARRLRPWREPAGAGEGGSSSDSQV